MTEPTSSGSGDLSFDKAIPTAGASGAAAPGVTCVNCKRPITDSYHTVNGLPICENCRAILEKAAGSSIELPVLGKAVVFGLGAAIAGAIIYWAVIEFLNLEIGLVAILTGWMVGTAMRKGAENHGGRLLQFLSVLLVYLSVSAAYLPFALRGAEGDVGIITVAFMLAVLPVFSIISSLPGGILSALIIGFGILQAWQLTGAAKIVFEGPFRVGGAAAS